MKAQEKKSPCGKTCRWCEFDGWVGPCCGECRQDCPAPVFDRKRMAYFERRDDGAILDAIAFRTMSEKAIIEHIHVTLMGPEEMDGEPTAGRRPKVHRDRVVRFVASLVKLYGGKLGGLTQKRLVAKVMKKVESRERKQAKADWDAYYRQHGSPNP